MKKLLLLCLLLLISTLTFASCSLLYTSKGVIYDISVDGTYAEVVGYEGDSKKIKIEKEFLGLPVKNIADGAFSCNDAITDVIIPDSVTSIGERTFLRCYSLKKISVVEKNENYKSIDGNLYTKDEKTLLQYAIGKTAKEFSIPNSVTSIGNYAFDSCSSLTSVVIPDSVTSIGYGAFAGCSSLTSVIIPNSVTSIGDWAFDLCYSLSSVKIPYSVTSIGEWAFSDCYSLNQISVDEKNENYKSIDGNLYTKDEKTLLQYAIGKTAKEFSIPDSVTSIGGGAFYDCDSLTSVVIPDSVTSIGDYALSFCDSLTSVLIPNSVTSIGDCAFYNCNSLTSVVIGDSVTSIGDEAFWKCSSLTSVVIGDSVASIGYDAFSLCFSLNEITVGEKNKYYKSIDGNLYTADEKILIQYAIGKTSTEFSIPDSVTSIGEYAFWCCSSLTSVIIPDSVTSIGDWAFYDCYALTSVVIGDSVTSIGYDAFYHCSSLTSVVLPDSVTSIGMWAFSRCSSLTSVVIPDSVTSIGEWAFSHCTSLTSVVIGDSVTSIGNYAFYGFDALTDVYYTGTEEEWATITIGSDNSALKNATIHFNYVPEE